MNVNIPAAILGIGLACIAAYLNIHEENATFLWLGVFFCFVKVVEW